MLINASLEGSQCNLSAGVSSCVMQESKGPYLQEESSTLQLHVSAQTLTLKHAFLFVCLFVLNQRRRRLNVTAPPT